MHQLTNGGSEGGTEPPECCLAIVRAICVEPDEGLIRLCGDCVGVVSAASPPIACTTRV